MNNQNTENLLEKEDDVTSSKKNKDWKEQSRVEKHEHNPYGAVIWALIIIMIGVIFLLNNLGILPWSIWSNIWRFWPVFLILVGIHMILGRSRLAALFIGLITLFVCGMILLFSVISNTGNLNLLNNYEWFRNIETTINSRLNQNALNKVEMVKDSSFENIKSREVSISIGSGKFSLDDSSSLDYFTASSQYYESYGVPVLESSSNNSKLKVNFYTINETSLNLFNLGTSKSYDLTLGRSSIPTDLKIDLGSGSGEIKLDSAKLNDVNIDVASGSLNMLLDESSIPLGDFDLNLSSGNLNLTLPNNFGVQVDYNVSSGNLSIFDNNVKGNGTFKSQNFNSAIHKITIKVNVSSGSMNIK